MLHIINATIHTTRPHDRAWLVVVDAPASPPSPADRTPALRALADGREDAFSCRV